MKSDIYVLFCVMVGLTGPWQTRGQSHEPPSTVTSSTLPGYTKTSASSDMVEDTRNELPQVTQNPVNITETVEPAAVTQKESTGHTEVSTDSGLETQPWTLTRTTVADQHTTVGSDAPFLSASTDRSSSTPTVSSAPQQTSTTEARVLVSNKPLATFSSQTAHTTQGTVSTATQPRPELLSTSTRKDTSPPQTPSASVRAPAVPTHQDLPSELNVGDEDLKGSRHHSSSPLDPLLAALLSVFILTTAIIFTILFLKFRQRTNHPEFHRLQDLPMDDLMEDTPLSRYTY